MFFSVKIALISSCPHVCRIYHGGVESFGGLCRVVEIHRFNSMLTHRCTKDHSRIEISASDLDLYFLPLGDYPPALHLILK